MFRFQWDKELYQNLPVEKQCRLLDESIFLSFSCDKKFLQLLLKLNEASALHVDVVDLFAQFAVLCQRYVKFDVSLVKTVLHDTVLLQYVFASQA